MQCNAIYKCTAQNHETVSDHSGHDFKNWFNTGCGIWRDSNYTTIMFKGLFHLSAENWLELGLHNYYVINNWHLLSSIGLYHSYLCSAPKTTQARNHHPLGTFCDGCQALVLHYLSWLERINFVASQSTLGSPGAIHPLCQKFGHLDTTK